MIFGVRTSFVGIYPTSRLGVYMRITAAGFFWGQIFTWTVQFFRLPNTVLAVGDGLAANQESLIKSLAVLSRQSLEIFSNVDCEC